MMEDLCPHGESSRVQQGIWCNSLPQAAMHDCPTEVVRLVNDGKNMNLQDSNGKTPLHIAIEGSYFLAVEKLLDLGADINIKDIYGRTALHVAARKEHLDVIDQLIQKGADVNALDDNDLTPLHAAVIEKRLAAVNKLLERGAESNGKDALGNSPLHDAALVGNHEMVNLLLAHKAAIEARNKMGQTPIHVAVDALYSWQKECGASPPRFMSRYASNDSFYPWEEDLKGTGYYSNANNNYFGSANPVWEVMKTLLKKGVDIDATDCNDETILHYAAKHGDSKWALLDYILSLKPNLYAQNCDGNTPLDIFLSKAQKVSVSSASNVQPIIDRYMISGMPALHLAVITNRHHVVEMLLNEGANINSRDSKHHTALHWAIYKNQDYLQFLLEKGADLNAKNVCGETPLHYATRLKCEKVIKWLIKNKAEIDAVDTSGKTVLHLAVSQRDVKRSLILMLLNKGAKLYNCDNFGQTPVDYVCRMPPSSTSRTVLKEYIVALKLLNVDLNVNVPAEMDFDFCKLLCLKELKNLEKVRCGNFSLADILSFKNGDPVFVSNKALEETMAFSLEEEYPLYSMHLKKVYKKAKKRYDLITSALEFFKLLNTDEHFKSTQLPIEMSRNVLSYLANKDLQTLVKVCAP